MPRRARVANQTSMTGPNTVPIREVPRFWKRKRSTRTAIVIGSTYGFSPGAAISTPSTAERTDIAGVMAPSP